MAQKIGVNIQWSVDELLEVAKWQRFVIWIVLFQLILTALFIVSLFGITSDGAWHDLAVNIMSLNVNLMIVMALISMVGVYKLTTSLKKSSPLIYPALMLLPSLLSLFVLLILSNDATNTLKMGRIRVGVMGANRSDLALALERREDQAEVL